jgi:signal transduction histidine kinase
MGTSAATRSWEVLLSELRAEFEIREAELSLLHEIDLQILRSERELPETLRFIATETAKLLGAEESQIYLRRGALLEAALENGFGRDPVAYEQSIFAACIEHGESMIVLDLPAEHPAGTAPIDDTEDVHSLVAVPIFLGATKLGVLSATHRTRARFGPTHLEMAEAVAAQIAIALENAELFDQSRLFEQVDSLIFSYDATEDVLQRALEEVFEELLRLDYATVTAAQLLFLRAGTEQLEIVHSTNPRDVGLPVSVDDSVSGRALRRREALVINDVAADPDYKRMLGGDIHSEIAVPILIGADNVAIGVLNVESPEPDAFGGVYQLLLERFSRKVTMLLAVTKLRTDIADSLESHHAGELMVAVGDQASNMVHKLNNVVGAMRVRVIEIQRNCAAEVEGSDFLRESLEHLVRGADETLELPKRVQRFLASENELSGYDVNESIEAALANVTIPPAIEVECQLEDGIPTVRSFSLDVAAENLIRNAVDAMRTGGTLHIASSVISSPGLPGGLVKLTFADTGTGMSETTRRRLFEIDFTTKRHKEGKGMGVGLWWVRQWVRRSGGEIEVRSSEGEGTSFEIKLPLSFAKDGAPIEQFSIRKGA